MRHALRRLISTPAFSLTATITLAAAIGANALIFSVVNGVLLKPLPYAQPETLVSVWHVAPGLMQGRLNQAPSTYFLYREQAESFTDIGLWDNNSVTLTGRGEPEQVEAIYVTDGTLPIIGVQPVIGRAFSREDDSPAGADAIMISHAYWLRAFGGDPGAINQSVVMDGRARQVIGVLPEGFTFLRFTPDVVAPFRFNRAEVRLGQFSSQGVARLKPGVTIEQANADIARLIPRLTDMFPMPPGLTREMFDEVKLGPDVRPLREDLVGDIGRTLWILLGAMGVVLLVACANVANLFLVRAEARQQELAVRLALGAGLRRIARELLSESLLLGIIGGGVGLALAYGGIQLLLALEPARVPRLNEIALDPLVLVFTFLISTFAGLLFGIAPILKYARPQLASALKENGRGSSDGRERHRTRNLLVVAQVAMALVLLVASGLFIRTFIAMRNVPPGFTEPDQVLTFRVHVPSAVVPDPPQVVHTHEEIQRALAAIPGVISVGSSSSITMDGNDNSDPIFAEGVAVADGKIPPLRRHKWVGANYFTTMGNPVIAGRDLTWADSHNRRPVALLSENLARELFGDAQAAVGRRVRQNPSQAWREVVGVVGTDYDDGVTAPATATVYWPMLQEDFWDVPLRAERSMAFAVRTERLRDPAFMKEVQQAVWSVNANLPLAGVETLRESYDASMAQTSFALVILGIAASVTLLLGVVGIYGVIAYVVAQRRREVGIRMALGAAAGEVQRLFIRHGLVVTGIGLVVGAAAAAAMSRLLSTLLFHTSPLDPLTYGACVLVLGLVAMVATWIPALRATRVDPATALRGD